MAPRRRRRNEPPRRVQSGKAQRRSSRGPSSSSTNWSAVAAGDLYGAADREREFQEAQRRALSLQAEHQYADNAARVSGIYDAMNDTLAPLGGQFAQLNAGIGNTLSTQLQGFAPAFGLTGAAGPAPEAIPGVEASPGPMSDNYANQAFGAIGASSLGLLANDASRVAAFQNSAQRQGAIEGMEAKRAYLTNLNDRLNEINALETTMGPDASEIAARAAQMRQDAARLNFEKRQWRDSERDEAKDDKNLARQAELIRQLLMRKAADAAAKNKGKDKKPSANQRAARSVGAGAGMVGEAQYQPSKTGGSTGRPGARQPAAAAGLSGVSPDELSKILRDILARRAV